MLRFLLALARHLDLVGEHALGYAELVRVECAASLRSWLWRVVAFALAALFVLIGLVSAAVVLSLWSNGVDVASWRAWARALPTCACRVPMLVAPALPASTSDTPSASTAGATIDLKLRTTNCLLLRLRS